MVKVIVDFNARTSEGFVPTRMPTGVKLIPDQEVFALEVEDQVVANARVEYISEDGNIIFLDVDFDSMRDA